MGGGVEDQDSWHGGMHHHQPAWYSAPWISDRSNSGSLGARLQWNDIGRRAVFFFRSLRKLTHVDDCRCMI